MVSAARPDIFRPTRQLPRQSAEEQDVTSSRRRQLRASDYIGEDLRQAIRLRDIRAVPARDLNRFDAEALARHQPLPLAGIVRSSMATMYADGISDASATRSR